MKSFKLFTSLLSASLLPATLAIAEEKKDTSTPAKPAKKVVPGVPMIRPDAPQAGTPVKPATKGTPLQPMPGKGAGGAQAPKVEPIQVGTPAPDFVSKDVSGKEIKLSNWKGKVIVLDFWATWCGPCKLSLPHTQAVAKAYKEKDVVILAVCTGDTREGFAKFVKENQDNYPDIIFTCDLHERGSPSFNERASRKLYGVAGIPAQFVIGRDGRIATSISGFKKNDHRLENALAKLGIEEDAAAPSKKAE